MEGLIVYIRKIAMAAGFAAGAALAFAPLASADASTDWWSSIDSLLGGGAPAAGTSDFQISFNGMDLLPTAGNEATATTVAGQFGLAIASGNGANAVAEGGTGNYALAEGTDALAKAGSTAAGATTSSYDSAIDIGNNTTAGAVGAPDGAYAGAGSLIGGVDSTGGSSHDSAYDIGNNGLDGESPLNGGNSGAFAGDGQLIGASGAGNGDTAYTAGDINGFGDGSAAVAGNNDYASTSGAETGTNEGAFAAFGNNNSAIADTSYTTDGAGVSATDGNSNYAFVYGPDNSGASAGDGNSNIAYVSDPFGTTGAADNATAGTGNSDLAEVLYTHGDASAQGGNFLYDILSPFGETATPAAATAAADPAATDISSTLTSEITSLNGLFDLDATLAGISGDITPGTGALPFDTIPTADANSIFDTLVFGLNPDSVTDGVPGSYDVLNGALGEFDNAYNVELFSLLNGGDILPVADLIGTHADLLNGTVSEAISGFLQLGVSDLAGFF